MEAHPKVIIQEEEDDRICQRYSQIPCLLMVRKIAKKMMEAIRKKWLLMSRWIKLNKE